MLLLLTGFIARMDETAAAAAGAAAPPGKPDYRRTLLPEKRKWSDSDREKASCEWQELKDRVTAASSSVAKGGVSDVLVTFRGRVAARRDMGKSLCFISVHALHRGDASTREAANWEVQGKGETLQALVDLSRWEGEEDFFVEAGLLRVEAEVILEGYCGKSEKHGDPLVYCRWARMTRAKPHPVFITTLFEHLIGRRLPAQRVAESLEMEVPAVEALVQLEAKPLRQQAARISRVMQGNHAQANRVRPPKLSPEQQRELDDSLALRTAFPIMALGRPQELEGEGEGLSLLPVEVSMPPVKMEETEQQRREKYSHGKKEPQVRWYVHRLRALMALSRGGSAAPSAWPYAHAPSSADAGAQPATRRPEEEKESEENGEGWVVVDIGGGRGDLAVNLARLLPAVKVHVVEINTPSLADAEQAATRLGPSVRSRCTFREEDVTKLFSSPSLLMPADSGKAVEDAGGTVAEAESKVVLVGLHACGGLTDAILALARRHHVAFLCCPCCFLKHKHLRGLAHESDDGAPCHESHDGAPCAPGGAASAPAGAAGRGDGTVAAGWASWKTDEWEAKWDQLARVGELTPHDGEAFVDTVAAHRLAMHALGAARLSRFDPQKVPQPCLSSPRVMFLPPFASLSENAHAIAVSGVAGHRGVCDAACAPPSLTWCCWWACVGTVEGGGAVVSRSLLWQESRLGGCPCYQPRSSVMARKEAWLLVHSTSRKLPRTESSAVVIKLIVKQS